MPSTSPSTAPHAVPTAIKKLRGNPGKRRIRPEIKWRKDGTIPAPPRYLGQGLAREEWLRIADEVHRHGLLTAVDLYPFACYCIAFEQWVHAIEDSRDKNGRTITTASTTNGTPMVNPALTAVRKAAFDMVRYGCEFGLTPASRSRIAVNAEEAGDEFDDLIKH
jgi:P27 family predicted phage terminase small subunit